MILRVLVQVDENFLLMIFVLLPNMIELIGFELE